MPPKKKEGGQKKGGKKNDDKKKLTGVVKKRGRPPKNLNKKNPPRAEPQLSEEEVEENLSPARLAATNISNGRGESSQVEQEQLIAEQRDSSSEEESHSDEEESEEESEESNEDEDEEELTPNTQVVVRRRPRYSDAGLVLPVGRIKRYMETEGRIRMTREAAVFFVGGLEYVLREIIVGALHQALLSNSRTLRSRHIMLAFHNDDGLNSITCWKGAIFKGSGVAGGINPVLLPPINPMRGPVAAKRRPPAKKNEKEPQPSTSGQASSKAQKRPAPQPSTSSQGTSGSSAQGKAKPGQPPRKKKLMNIQDSSDDDDDSD